MKNWSVVITTPDGEHPVFVQTRTLMAAFHRLVQRQDTNPLMMRAIKITIEPEVDDHG